MKSFKFIFMICMALMLVVGLASAERLTIFNVTPIVSDTTDTYNVTDQNWNWAFNFTKGDSLDTLRVYVDASSNGGSTWSTKWTYTMTATKSDTKTLYFDDWGSNACRIRMVKTSHDATGSKMYMYADYEPDLSGYIRQVKSFADSVKATSDTLTFVDIYKNIIVSNVGSDIEHKLRVRCAGPSLDFYIWGGQQITLPLIGLTTPVIVTSADSTIFYSVLLTR